MTKSFQERMRLIKERIRSAERMEGRERMLKERRQRRFDAYMARIEMEIYLENAGDRL